jgi:hypothetical protein
MMQSTFVEQLRFDLEEQNSSYSEDQRAIVLTALQTIFLDDIQHYIIRHDKEFSDLLDEHQQLSFSAEATLLLSEHPALRNYVWTCLTTKGEPLRLQSLEAVLGEYIVHLHRQRRTVANHSEVNAMLKIFGQNNLSDAYTDIIAVVLDAFPELTDQILKEFQDRLTIEKAETEFRRSPKTLLQ